MPSAKPLTSPRRRPRRGRTWVSSPACPLDWNDGATESFAYTEIDNTIALGADLRGTAWSRGGDKLGVATVSSGLSDDHCRYLAPGGKGFPLGSGRLRYGRETLLETYYTA